MGRRPRRAQRPLCGRAPVSSEMVGHGCRRPTGNRGRGAPRSVSARIIRKDAVPIREGRFGEGLGRGNPRELAVAAVATQRGARPEYGARPRGRGSMGLRFHGTNGEEAGSLETGHPLDSGRASNGRGRSEECRTVDASRRVGRKPGEPQDRLRGATNPRSRVWSKPPKSGGTTRAERVRMWQPRTSGNREHTHGDVGGGAIFEELQERNPRPSGGFGRPAGEGSEQNGWPSKRRRRYGEREWRKPFRIESWSGETLTSGRANHPRRPMPCDVKTARHPTCRQPHGRFP
jgi:hypothetical protein